jgi:hypothetical protein
VHIGLMSKPGHWDDIIIDVILSLMFQSSTLIGTMPCPLMEVAIQIRVPILQERVGIWSWI